MIFTDLVQGDSFFVDANTWVYRFSTHPKYTAPCTALVDRIEQGELAGYTSTHVLSETAHRLMTLEAITLFGWPQTGIAGRLRKHPGEIAKLTTFQKAVTHILNIPLPILSIAPQAILIATSLSQTHGLLSNDALLVAVMQGQGLTKLASADTDFDRVPGLSRYAPV